VPESYYFESELDCPWMTIDVGIRYTRESNDVQSFFEIQSVRVIGPHPRQKVRANPSGLTADLTRLINDDYIFDLIEEHWSSGDHKDYGDG